jgi:hypothetical protein
MQNLESVLLFIWQNKIARYDVFNLGDSKQRMMEPFGETAVTGLHMP